MDIKTSLYVFMTALFSSLLMVPLLRRWALDRGEVDKPEFRKIHLTAVPRIGGIAIFISFLFSLLVFIDLTREIRGILAGGLVVFFTGLIDDLHGLSPKRKFVGQIAASLVSMGVGQVYITRLGDIFGGGAVSLPPWFGVPFTIFAVVGVINAINLIDGLDGLAGGVSVIALCALFALGTLDGNFPVAILSAGLLGAVLGFLKYNFYPARIFMGDTGSMTVGYFLGSLAILLTQIPQARVTPVIPVLVLGVPLIDTVWVMCRRVFRGLSPFSPDKTHVHHQFLDFGFQHRLTVVVIYGISLFWACYSVIFHRLPGYILLYSYLLLSIGEYIGLRHILHHRERFRFLKFDSSRGIRESSLFLRTAARVEGIALPLLAVLIVFFLSVVFLAGHFDHNFWQISLVIFLAGMGLLFYTRDPGNEFLLAMLFLAAFTIVFVTQLNGSRYLWGTYTLRNFANVLFFLMAGMITLRIFFQKPGEFFLNTVDFLVLAMSIFFAVFLPQIDHGGIFTATLPKGIILFLAVKIISVRGRNFSALGVGLVLAVLAVISIRSYFLL